MPYTFLFFIIHAFPLSRPLLRQIIRYSGVSRVVCPTFQQSVIDSCSIRRVEVAWLPQQKPLLWKRIWSWQRIHVLEMCSLSIDVHFSGLKSSGPTLSFNQCTTHLIYGCNTSIQHAFVIKMKYLRSEMKYHVEIVNLWWFINF